MIRLYALGIFGGHRSAALVFRVTMTVLTPIAAAILSYQCQWKVAGGLPSLLISSFSIFSAMLFTSQVAAFSVFNHKMLEVDPKHSDDGLIRDANIEKSHRRKDELRSAFRKINAGISVLTLLAVCITGLTFAIVSSPPVLVEQVLTLAVISLSVHFLASFILTCMHVFWFFDSAYLKEDD